MKLEKSLNGSISGIMQGSINGEIEMITKPPVLETLTVDHNGVYLPPSGVDGFDKVEVFIPTTIRNLIAESNGTYTVPSGVDGFNPVVVNVPSSTTPLKVKQNGIYTPPSGFMGFSSVDVDTDSNVILFEDGVFYENENYDLRYYQGTLENNKLNFSTESSGIYLYTKTPPERIIMKICGNNPNDGKMNFRCGRCLQESSLPSILQNGRGRISSNQYTPSKGDFIQCLLTANLNSNECVYFSNPYSAQGSNLPYSISKIVIIELTVNPVFQ